MEDVSRLSTPLAEFQDNLEEKGYKTKRMYKKDDDLSDWRLHVTLDEEAGSVVRFDETGEPPYVFVSTQPHTEKGTQLLDEWLQKKLLLSGDPYPDRFMTKDCDNDELPPPMPCTLTGENAMPGPLTRMKTVAYPYHPENDDDEVVSPIPIRRQCSNVFGLV